MTISSTFGIPGHRANKEKQYKKADRMSLLFYLIIYRLRLNRRFVFSRVAARTSARDMPFISAIFSAVKVIIEELQRFALNGTGARYGQSVSISNRSRGISSMHSTAFRAFLKVTTPVIPIYIPSFRISFIISTLPE